MVGIGRVGRTSLGACYRSELGVLTRPGEWRIIVCIEPGYGVDIDEQDIRQKYESLRDELVEGGRTVTLEFNDRWIKELAKPLESESQFVQNLVFIVGGGNPTVFSYFKNYVYDEGGPLPIYDGATRNGFHYQTETATVDERYWDISALPVPHTSQQLADWYEAGAATIPPPTTTKNHFSEDNRVACRHRETSFLTDYSPGFEEVRRDIFSDDHNEFLGDREDFASARTVFFFDPLDIPPAASRNRHHYSTERNDVPSTGEVLGPRVWLHYPFGNPLSTPELLFDPATVSPIDVFLGQSVWEVPTGTSGVTKAYHCMAVYEDGAMWDFYALSDGAESTVGEEGVDQSNDSRDATESIIEEIVDNYGPEEARFSWRYRGRVDSNNLKASEISGLVPA